MIFKDLFNFCLFYNGASDIVMNQKNLPFLLKK